MHDFLNLDPIQNDAFVTSQCMHLQINGEKSDIVYCEIIDNFERSILYSQVRFEPGSKQDCCL